GAKLRPFRHNRMDKLQKMLERAAEDGGGTLVVVDGVYSMEGDLCDLPAIVDLCERHGARLMVDEAHGVGVLGARGAGACELFGLEDRVDLRMIRSEGPELFERLLENARYLRQGFRELGLVVVEPGTLPGGEEANTPV